MYRKIYGCQVKMWQIDATGKRALKWITMPVEKTRQRADVAVRCFECRGPIRLHSLGPRNVPQAHAEHRQKSGQCRGGASDPLASNRRSSLTSNRRGIRSDQTGHVWCMCGL